MTFAHVAAAKNSNIAMGKTREQAGNKDGAKELRSQNCSSFVKRRIILSIKLFQYPFL